MRLALTLLITLSMTLFAKSEDRPVKNFEKIEFEGFGNLIISQDGGATLRVTADDGVIGQLKTTVDGNSLKIETPRGIGSQTPITYEVGVRRLKKISLEGAAMLSNTGTLTTEMLVLEIQGASKADLTIEGTELKVEINGAGQVNMAGQVEHQEVEVNGAGRYLAFDLQTESTDIEINGTGKAEVSASERLNVEVNGAGSVSYRGNPKVSQKIRGIGTVSHGAG
ncbi:MAG: head GIN domain-containing protein [Parachlamydiales bacterium]